MDEIYKCLYILSNAVFNLRLSLGMVVKICVLYLIIINIKLEVRIINHWLGLGHETKVCGVLLGSFQLNWSVVFYIMILEGRMLLLIIILSYAFAVSDIGLSPGRVGMGRTGRTGRNKLQWQLIAWVVLNGGIYWLPGFDACAPNCSIHVVVCVWSKMSCCKWVNLGLGFNFAVRHTWSYDINMI